MVILRLESFFTITIEYIYHFKFLFYRKGKEVCTFVPTYEANERIPSKVIEFYESRICVSNLYLYRFFFFAFIF